MNPSGLCLCGCGSKTKVHPKSWARMGWVRGQPRDYMPGHAARMAWHKKLVAPGFQKGRETAQQRRKRTQKLGPYKAGRTVMAQKAVGKIEAAMKRRR